MEKQVSINGKARTININDMYVTGVVRTGLNVNGTCFNYSLVCSNNAPVENIDDIFADISSVSMFNGDVRVPITDARLRNVKSLQALAAPAKDDTADAILQAWDAQVENVFKGRKIPVKTLTASVSELSGGRAESYTLKWEVDGHEHIVENVTSRTTAYIDDDIAAYERLRKAVMLEIEKNEEKGE